jgi:squalene-associated FAD-dependent desaturase
MAGLAAASRLASRGASVTVFEPAKQLGGRARGIEYKGVMLDNGQHIMLGAYRETLALLAQADVDTSQAFLRLPLQLHMQDIKNKQAISLQARNWLPAPLHILGGFLAAQGLSLGSKLAALRFMTWAQLQRFQLKHDIPLREFLAQRKQTHQLTAAIWEPLCLAALNTPISEASAQVFLNVLRDSFARKKSDSDMLLPRADLNTMLAQPLADWLCGQGAKFVRHSVKKVESSESGFNVFTDAQAQPFSHVILACGPHQLKHIELPDAVANALPTLEYQPITTVYLQFDEHLQLPRPMTGLVNSLSQWVLDRGRMCGQKGLLAVVISADKSSADMPNAKLAEQVLAELKQAFPNLGEPLWHKVITEKFATFACKPDLARPTGLTPLPGLFLTGDYIENGYPATIEGAVRNGVACTNLVVSMP